jgi:ankyrin repeat protein
LWAKDVAELLLANRADVNATTVDGETPLHWAAAVGDKDVVELLSKHGGHE